MRFEKRLPLKFGTLDACVDLHVQVICMYIHQDVILIRGSGRIAVLHQADLHAKGVELSVTVTTFKVLLSSSATVP